MYQVIAQTKSGNMRMKETNSLLEAKEYANLCAGKYKTKVTVIKEQKLYYAVELSVFYDSERNVAR